MSFKRITNQALVALMLVIALVSIPDATIHAQGRSSNTTPPNPITTLTQTTLSSAVGTATPPISNGGSIIAVTSATGFTAGNMMVILTNGSFEAMDIVSVSSTNITVLRATHGTTRAAHNSGDIVFTQRAALFFASDPKGACATSTAGTGATALVTNLNTPTPYINVNDANIFYCGPSGSWVKTMDHGYLPSGASHTYVYAAAGAIFPVPGVVFIGTAGALAMTIAPPTADLDGITMCIVASTAQAHTVTYTAGFSQSTTSSDVATFGGAVNDNFCIVARGTVWQVISTRNVTIA